MPAIKGIPPVIRLKAAPRIRDGFRYLVCILNSKNSSL
ncbi:hypothetical protein B4099_1108 [Heyndrickxia coagulans]|uniref:Uncharacterized protein n=1 Tax=Heyndrickxia coagulans TaxID=1398 RepID=A0A150KFV1_HEYCO|nr:hypothetical protein B4099_1108 [Heyndrickxia coagulans]